MTFKEWLKKAEDFREKNGAVLLPELLLNNGNSISVQSSRFHVCTVGEDFEVYTHGVNYKELEGFGEVLDGTIYGHVSYEALTELCENNGGIYEII